MTAHQVRNSSAKDLHPLLLIVVMFLQHGTSEEQIHEGHHHRTSWDITVVNRCGGHYHMKPNLQRMNEMQS